MHALSPDGAEPVTQASAPRRLPVARPTTLRGTLLAMVPPAAFALVGWLLWGGLLDGAFLGVMAWFALRFLLVRMVLARPQNRGTALARAGDYARALESFRDSEALWARLPVLDRFRAVLLGTTTRWSYRALAVYNQALCQAQLGRPGEALETLRRLEQLSPGLPEARELRGWLAQVGPQPAPWFDPEELA